MSTNSESYLFLVLLRMKFMVVADLRTMYMLYIYIQCHVPVVLAIAGWRHLLAKVSHPQSVQLVR